MLIWEAPSFNRRADLWPARNLVARQAIDKIKGTPKWSRQVTALTHVLTTPPLSITPLVTPHTASCNCINTTTIARWPLATVTILHLKSRRFLAQLLFWIAIRHHHYLLSSKPKLSTILGSVSVVASKSFTMGANEGISKSKHEDGRSSFHQPIY